jgi:transposase
MLTPQTANAEGLQSWMTRLRTANLPTLHSFATGLQRDHDAVEAALTLPFHNGRTEDVNHKIKLLKPQTYGRAGFPLLRQRILLS